MKHTKKLIPAIGMLLLSACMLVTSTFAWFSMNDTVTATGMSVSAKGDQVYLQIINDAAEAKFNNGAAQTTAAATKKGYELLPTNVKVATTTGEGESAKTEYSAYNGGKNFVWVTAIGKNTSQNYTDENGQEQTDGHTPVAGYNEVSSTTAYYLKNTFQIRLDSTAGATTAGGPLRVQSVDFTDTYASDTLRNAVCVLVVCGNYSQLYTNNAGAFTLDAKSNHYLNTDNDTKANFNNTTGVTVDIYVFFNGDNAACTLENLAKAKNGEKYNTYSVDVTFTVSALPQND